MGKILFTGTTPSMCKLSGELVSQPLITLKPVDDMTLVDKAIQYLTITDWIIFTSQFTVTIFFDRLKALQWDHRSHAVKMASIGQTTSDRLLRQGFKIDLQPEIESSTGLVKAFKEHVESPKHILIPRSDRALTVLPDGLKTMGHNVSTVVVYSNQLPPKTTPYDLTEFDRVVFTAPSTVINFHQVYGDFPDTLFYYVQGEETAKELAQWIDSAHFEQISR